MRHISAEALRYLLEHERDTFSKSFGTTYYTNSPKTGQADPIMKAITEDRWKKATAALDKALGLYLKEE